MFCPSRIPRRARQSRKKLIFPPKQSNFPNLRHPASLQAGGTERAPPPAPLKRDFRDRSLAESPERGRRRRFWFIRGVFGAGSCIRAVLGVGSAIAVAMLNATGSLERRLCLQADFVLPTPHSPPGSAKPKPLIFHPKQPNFTNLRHAESVRSPKQNFRGRSLARSLGRRRRRIFRGRFGGFRGAAPTGSTSVSQAAKRRKGEEKAPESSYLALKSPPATGRMGFAPPSHYRTGKCPVSGLGIRRSKHAAAITAPREDGLIPIT